MPKHQTNLNSFFGAAASGSAKKTKNPQTRVDSFFAKKKDQRESSNAGQEKENSKNKRPINESGAPNEEIPAAKSATKDNNNDNDNVDKATNKKAKTSKISADAKRKRRVIDDDDDDDEDEEMVDIPSDISSNKATDSPSSDVKADTGIIIADSESQTKKDSGAENDDDNKEEEKTPNKSPLLKDTAQTLDKDKKSIEKSTTKKGKTEAAKNGIKSDSGVSTQSKAAATSSSSPAADAKAAPSSSTKMPYSDLCEAFEKIEAITGRLQIQEIMTELFRKQIAGGDPENLYLLMYLCSNSVAPAYECVELGIGDAILIKAIAESYGTKNQFVKEKYESLGDLGTVAQQCKGKQRTLGGFFASSAKKKPLDCREILATFREIAQMKGNQSQKFKTEKIKKLLVNATSHPAEPKYIIRALQGKLRIGLAESTVLISLAHALALDVPPKAAQRLAENKVSGKDKYPQEALEYCDKKITKEKKMEAAVAIVKKAYSEVPSYDALVDAALSVPLQELHQACTLTPGIPVAPMLAKPTKSILEVLKRLNGQRFTCEYKYDGERGQVHMLPDGKAKVFSRNLLDTTEKFPEVPLFVKEAASSDVESCVCDVEVVAWDVAKEKLVPFQVLSTRKKTEESAETAKVQVIVQAFDLMYLNGESLLGRSLHERRDLLHKHFSVVPGKFTFAVSLDHKEDGDTTVIEEFLDAAVKGQCEGLMVKTLDDNANYEPSRRSLNWLKLKKDYLEGLGDSVDLVPIGAYHGKGKRTGVYGAYLMACYDPDTEEFQSVCKLGTGFSDEDLKSLAANLNKHIIPSKTSQYNTSDLYDCDVWFDCVQVWEVKAADLSQSSTHRGAVGKTGEEGRGIALRFPRFERIREDKRPEMATTSDQILDMYYNQDSVGGKGDMMDDGI